VKGIGIPRSILIVDDDLAITDTLSTVFEKHGYEVRCAHSAEVAIETISRWAPDLAIIDVMLPRMNGIELFSGHTGTQALIEEAAKKGNMFEILVKPVHPFFMLDFVSSLFADATRGTT
jgi:DNA-binding NtrC family response regulator